MLDPLRIIGVVKRTIGDVIYVHHFGVGEERKFMEQFIESAKEAGFTEAMAEFMWGHLAKYPHTHTVDEIDGIEDYVDAAIEGEEEEEEEEGEEDE